MNHNEKNQANTENSQVAGGTVRRLMGKGKREERAPQLTKRKIVRSKYYLKITCSCLVIANASCFSYSMSCMLCWTC